MYYFAMISLHTIVLSFLSVFYCGKYESPFLTIKGGSFTEKLVLATSFIVFIAPLVYFFYSPLSGILYIKGAFLISAGISFVLSLSNLFFYMSYRKSINERKEMSLRMKVIDVTIFGYALLVVSGCVLTIKIPAELFHKSSVLIGSIGMLVSSTFLFAYSIWKKFSIKSTQVAYSIFLILCPLVFLFLNAHSNLPYRYGVLCFVAMFFLGINIIANTRPIKYSSGDDRKTWMLSSILLSIPIIYLTLNTFYLLHYRHGDAIGYLNSIINPLVFMGRFQPMALQELNILRDFSLDFLLPQYSFSFLTFFVFLLLVWRLSKGIVSSLHFSILASLMCMFPFIQEVYSSTIFAEAEALIFLTLGLLAYRYYYESGKRRWAVVSISSFTISLYYKETNFLFVGGFSFSILIQELWNNRKDIFSRYSFKNEIISFIHKNAYHILNGLSCFIFLFGYWFFVYTDMPENTYSPGGWDIYELTKIFVFSRPLIPACFILLLAIGTRFKSGVSQPLYVGLTGGSTIFLLGCIFGLSLASNDYYYYLSFFGVMIASSLLFSQPVREPSGFFEASYEKYYRTYTLLLKVLLIFVVIVMSYSEINRTINATLRAKLNQSNSYAMANAFDFSVPGKNILFLMNNENFPIYRAGVLTESIKQAYPGAKFNLVTEKGCSPWISNENVKCIVGDEKYFNYQYDYVALYNYLEKDINWMQGKYDVYNIGIPDFLKSRMKNPFNIYIRNDEVVKNSMDDEG